MFLTDPVTQAPDFAFSPDGTIIYAKPASDNGVHFHQFY